MPLAFHRMQDEVGHVGLARLEGRFDNESAQEPVASAGDGLGGQPVDQGRCALEHTRGDRELPSLGEAKVGAMHLQPA